MNVTTKIETIEKVVIELSKEEAKLILHILCIKEEGGCSEGKENVRDFFVDLQLKLGNIGVQS